MSEQDATYRLATYRLDGTCPWCRGDTDISEVFDGSERNCANCGRPVVAVAWTNHTMSLHKVEREAPDPRSAHQRTRTRWRKQGRR
jgi:hypothetical protein